MKRIVPIILALALVLSLAGCSGKKAGPDAAVTAFCGAIQAFDFEKAADCMEHGVEDWETLYDGQQLEEELDSEPAVTYLKECAAKMTYELGEVKEDGESATVPVTFTYVDAQPVFNAVLDEYIAQAFALAMTDADDAEIDALFDSVFEEQAQSVETNTASVDMDFKCVRVDGEWKIAAFSEDDERLINDLVTGNMVSTMESYGVFGEDYEEIDDYEDDNGTSEITEWSDIPMGNGTRLGTFSIIIEGCDEAHDLSELGMESEEAPDGSKFVVFYVNVQNATDEEIIFSNIYLLSDNQGRSFEPYYTMYSLEEWETFLFAELQPDEEKSGMFIYVVPEDCEEYYVTVTEPDFGIGARLYADW